ncbi:hypothetical protein ABE036_25860 [Priestia aryabhattai]|uniref:hypothetical protein n=1 Tax=Priestia aryabhattai TaxID=412384 RepID=UPI003D2D97AF
MNLLEVFTQIVTLVEAMSKILELLEKVPFPIILVAFNFNYSPQKSKKDLEEGKHKKELS